MNMISLLYAMLGPLKSMAGQNEASFLACSILSAVSLECGCILRLDFLGVTVGMIVTVGFFIIMDWWTGSAASHTKSNCTQTKGIWMNEKHRIKKSTKLLFYHI
jgi:hypothetical protein